MSDIELVSIRVIAIKGSEVEGTRRFLVDAQVEVPAETSVEAASWIVDVIARDLA
jgi:hypothetical protein